MHWLNNQDIFACWVTNLTHYAHNGIFPGGGQRTDKRKWKHVYSNLFHNQKDFINSLEPLNMCHTQKHKKVVFLLLNIFVYTSVWFDQCEGYKIHHKLCRSTIKTFKIYILRATAIATFGMCLCSLLLFIALLHLNVPDGNSTLFWPSLFFINLFSSCLQDLHLLRSCDASMNSAVVHRSELCAGVSARAKC